MQSYFWKTKKNKEIFPNPGYFNHWFLADGSYNSSSCLHFNCYHHLLHTCCYNSISGY